MNDSNLRALDIDDLLLLTLLLEGCKVKSICKVLYKTPPAITCRLNKYQKVFGDEFFTYSQIMRRRELSDNGRAVAGQAKKALNVLLGEEHISIGTLLNIR